MDLLLFERKGSTIYWYAGKMVIGYDPYDCYLGKL